MKALVRLLRTFLFVMAITTALSFSVSCQSFRGRPIPQLTAEELEAITIRSVRVDLFTCEDSIVAEAVQNMFIAELAAMTLPIVTDGEADLVISGTITTAFDESSSGKSSSLAWGGGAGSPQSVGAGMMGGGSGKFAHSAGHYVSGVSSLAHFKGRVVSSGASSQSRRGGHAPDAPEKIAARAANDLRWKLQAARTQKKIHF